MYSMEANPEICPGVFHRQASQAGVPEILPLICAFLSVISGRNISNRNHERKMPGETSMTDRQADIAFENLERSFEKCGYRIFLYFNKNMIIVKKRIFW